MIETPRRRGLAITVLLVILTGFFVLFGTIEPDSAHHNYPNTENIAEGHDRYIGERVVVSGQVTQTAPLTIHSGIGTQGRLTFELENNDLEADRGDNIGVYGTLQADHHIQVIDAVRQEPEEVTYMYAVSCLGGLLVLGRFVNNWTVDTTRRAVVPRSESILEGLSG